MICLQFSCSALSNESSSTSFWMVWIIAVSRVAELVVVVGICIGIDSSFSGSSFFICVGNGIGRDTEAGVEFGLETGDDTGIGSCAGNGGVTMRWFRLKIKEEVSFFLFFFLFLVSFEFEDKDEEDVERCLEFLLRLLLLLAFFFLCLFCALCGDNEALDKDDTDDDDDERVDDEREEEDDFVFGFLFNDRLCLEDVDEEDDDDDVELDLDVFVDREDAERRRLCCWCRWLEDLLDV